MKLINQSTQKELCNKIKIANSMSTRMIGLIGTKSLEESGLYIPGCNWIHTFFMSMPIDVVYVDKKGVVRKIDSQLQPWKLPMPVFSARNVIELPAGFAQKNELKIGDQLYVGH